VEDIFLALSHGGGGVDYQNISRIVQPLITFLSTINMF
jgi:hypothetical protein